MSINKNQKVQHYIDTVLQQIEYKEVHEEIRAVLESRMNKLIGFYNLKVASKEEAIHKAITEMGNPVELGRELAWLGTLFTLGYEE